jgi:phosphoglycerate dehydrogenase-like enzyme
VRLIITPQIAATYADAIRAAVPGVELVTLDEHGAWHGDPAGADAAYLSFDMYPSGIVGRLLAELPRLSSLRWVHTYSVGVDHPMYLPLVERGLLFTNGAGSQSIPIAQHILLWM